MTWNYAISVFVLSRTGTGLSIGRYIVQLVLTNAYKQETWEMGSHGSHWPVAP